MTLMAKTDATANGRSNPEALAVEEVVNVVTHGIGAILSLGALSLMVTLAIAEGTALTVASAAAFGITLFLLYLASTLYHSARRDRTRLILKICDHCAIFLLIAGTYTPFTLLVLEGPWSWAMSIAVWAGAAAGVLFKIFWIDCHKAVSILLYVILGWIGVIAIGPLIARLDPGGVVWLALGGIAYTTGIAFYVWERLPFNHAVWHVFVVAGSACHFLAVFYYVLPVRA